MKITLEAILRALSHETLSFMSDSNHANGTIQPDQIPKVVGRINGVLRRLSVKFVLNEKTVTVRVTEAQRTYSLAGKAPWIINTGADPFLGDVNTILGIESSCGRMFNLRDKATHNSILLKDEGTSFVLDKFLPEGDYTVFYKASTPQFTESVNPDLTEVLNIPESLLNALYLGVAALTYEGIGGEENVNMARNKWRQYDNDCQEAKIYSAVEDEEHEQANKFMDRGFR